MALKLAGGAESKFKLRNDRFEGTNIIVDPTALNSKFWEILNLFELTGRPSMNSFSRGI